MICVKCKKHTNKKTKLCEDCKKSAIEKFNKEERIKKHLSLKLEEELEELEEQNQM